MNWENLEPNNKAKKEYEEAKKKREEYMKTDYSGIFSILLMLVGIFLLFFRGCL